MRLLVFYLMLNLFFSALAHSAVDTNLSFTNKDMWKLSEKITKAIRRCKPLRKGGAVVVDVENATTEFVDKTQFAELIHSMVEKKTHVQPQREQPDYEIHAKLEAPRPLNPLVPTAKFTLTAQVFQAEELLCEKKVSIAKKHMKSDP